MGLSRLASQSALVLALCLAPAGAQTDDSDVQQRDRWTEYYARQLPKYKFHLASDPEVIVVLASRRTPNGPQWHFAAGRFALNPLELKHKQRTVWEFTGQGSRQTGYFSQHGIDVQPLVPELDDGGE